MFEPIFVAMYEPDEAKSDLLMLYIHGNCETVFTIDSLMK